MKVKDDNRTSRQSFYFFYLFFGAVEVLPGIPFFGLLFIVAQFLGEAVVTDGVARQAKSGGWLHADLEWPAQVPPDAWR